MHLFSKIWIGLALCSFAVLASAAHAQPVTAPVPPPAVGMVDKPCGPLASGRSPTLLALAHAMVQDGPLDLSGVKDYAGQAADISKADEQRVKNDWADLCRYRLANETLAGTGARVVFLGDSITELWQAADPEFFANGLVDRGVSGQTSGQLLLRFYPDVVDLRPSVVHIMVGTNDVAGNNGANRPEDFKNNIRAMVDIAKAHHIKIVLASIPPASSFAWKRALHPAEQISALNAWLEDFARVEGLTYVDYYRVLVGPDGGMKAGTSRDGVHPLVSGYALMKPLAQSALAKAMHASKP